jgi:hypothetical protein
MRLAAKQRRARLIKQKEAAAGEHCGEAKKIRQHRQRIIVASIAVIGAGQLGISLSTKPGSIKFYVLTNGVAATWFLGSLFSRPGCSPSDQEKNPHHKSEESEISTLNSVSIGLGAFLFFYLCALVCRKIPLLNKAISSILRYAHRGSLPYVLATTLITGAAEEVFFRGALYDVAGQHPVKVSTAVYAATTAATRNPALVLASLVMGSLFGAQRRISHGVMSPLITHLTWSTLMTLLLPSLFKDSRRSEQTAGGGDGSR